MVWAVTVNLHHDRLTGLQLLQQSSHQPGGMSANHWVQLGDKHKCSVLEVYASAEAIQRMHLPLLLKPSPYPRHLALCHDCFTSSSLC